MDFLRRNLYDLAFLLLLVVFVLFKVRDIATPYFWDELGVYMPGALAMKDNGTICLLPSCLEPLYSRGHPLLFVFSQALWMRLFGDSVTAAHAFSILLAAGTLGVFYCCARDLFRERIAFFSALLLAVQPVFFAMSGMVFPEMMLTMFTIPAIWALIRERWGIYVIAASLAMMVKESAIVIPGTALLLLFIESLKRKDLFTLHRVKLFFYGSIPLLVYAAFLVVQKIQNGWYFFPEHIGYIHSDGLADKVIDIVRSLLLKQGRWLIGILFLAGYVRLHRRFMPDGFYARICLVVGVFLVLAVVSAGLNFYLLRYMLYAVPFIVLIAVSAASSLFPGKRILGSFLVQSSLASVGLALLHMDDGKFNDAADMSYKHIVKLEQDAIRWTEQQPWKDAGISANFPVFQGMGDKRNGYLKGAPLNYSVNIEKQTPYGVFFHLKEDEPAFWNERKYKVLKRFSHGQLAHITVVAFD